MSSSWYSNMSLESVTFYFYFIYMCLLVVEDRKGVSYPLWVLGIELQLSGRTGSARDHQVISLDHKILKCK